MIKRVSLPISCVVTGVASIAVVPFVGVVFLVATDAGARDIAIVIGLGMARVATRDPMFVKQREASLGVVKVRYTPVFCAVTGLALFA